MAEGPLLSSGPIVVYVETALAIGYDPAKTTKRLELVTASGVELAPRLTVRAVRCLGQTVRKLDVVCHDLPAESPVKGLLGLNFLRHFNLHLNFLQNNLTLLR